MQKPFMVSFAVQPLAAPVESVSGLGEAEHWGRWNDDTRVRIRFQENLPAAFEAQIVCAVTSANIGRFITVIVGGCARRFVCTGTLTKGLEVAKLNFRCDQPSRVMEFLIPDVEPGGAIDARPLGLGLSTMTIVPLEAVQDEVEAEAEPAERQHG